MTGFVYGGELEAYALVAVIAAWVAWGIRGAVERQKHHRDMLLVEKAETIRIRDKGYRLVRNPRLDDVKASVGVKT